MTRDLRPLPDAKCGKCGRPACDHAEGDVATTPAGDTFRLLVCPPPVVPVVQRLRAWFADRILVVCLVGLISCVLALTLGPIYGAAYPVYVVALVGLRGLWRRRQASR